MEDAATADYSGLDIVKERAIAEQTRSGEDVSDVVHRMLQAGVALAVTGSLGRAASERARTSLLLAA